MTKIDEYKEPIFELKDILQYSFVLVVILSFAIVHIDFRDTQKETPPVAEIPGETTHFEVVVPANPFSLISLKGTAAAVFDVKRERFLFTRAADAPLALASITKLMTAIVASEMADPHDRVRIPAEALLKEGDSGLLLGETWTVKNLIDYTMVVSSNDGAAALALLNGQKPYPGQGDGALLPHPEPDRRFVSLMNSTSARLGLRNTHFNNATGLDEGETQGGSYGTARDVAKLMAYALNEHPDILHYTIFPASVISSLDMPHNATNTNILAGKIPNLLGSKTGFTDVAGGNLVVAFDGGINEPMVLVTLGSTPDGRFEDIETLAHATRAFLANEDIFQNQ